MLTNNVIDVYLVTSTKVLGKPKPKFSPITPVEQINV